MITQRISRSLRLKLTLGVMLPLVVVLAILSIGQYLRHQSRMLSTLSLVAAQTNEVIEGSLEKDMLPRNLDGIQHTLDAVSSRQDIVGVYLLDTSGQIMFGPQGNGVGRRLDNRDPACQPCHASPTPPYPNSVVVNLAGGQRVFRSMQPIENQPKCQSCHAPEQRLLGLLLTDISTAPLEDSLAADLRETLLWGTATLLITVIVVNVGMSRMVTRRLELVAQTLAHFGRGQLGLRLPADSPDEIGQLAKTFNNMAGRIQTEESENEALSADLRRHMDQQQGLLKRLITAQEDERARVARDLHDELGQDLAGLAVGLEAVERLWERNPEHARRQLAEMRRHIAGTTDRTYDMILTLRPPMLDDLGLVSALRAHAERVLNNTGIRFTLEACDTPCRMAPQSETAVFRIFQEALSNSVRHAQAGAVHVSLAQSDGVFTVSIADDGRGFDPASVTPDGAQARGMGLLGMQERVAQCGGTFALETAPGRGTRITIRIPIVEGHRE